MASMLNLVSILHDGGYNALGLGIPQFLEKRSSAYSWSDFISQYSVVFNQAIATFTLFLIPLDL